jgi:hypothetical protein
MWSSRWDENWQGNRKISEKIILTSISHLRWNPGRRTGKSAKNQTHGIALIFKILKLEMTAMMT